MTVKERSYKQSVEISCHLAVGVVLERVNVEPKSSGKQNRILWNDRQPRPQRPEADFRDVNAVDQDWSVGRFQDPEQCQRQRGLSGTGPSNDPDLLTGRDFERDAFEDQFEALSVPGFVVGELNLV